LWLSRVFKHLPPGHRVRSNARFSQPAVHPQPGWKVRRPGQRLDEILPIHIRFKDLPLALARFIAW
jgi:hypothetical protein